MFNLLGRKLAEAPAGGAPADCSYPARQGPHLCSHGLPCLATGTGCAHRVGGQSSHRDPEHSWPPHGHWRSPGSYLAPPGPTLHFQTWLSLTQTGWEPGCMESLRPPGTTNNELEEGWGEG